MDIKQTIKDWIEENEVIYYYIPYTGNDAFISDGNIIASVTLDEFDNLCSYLDSCKCKLKLSFAFLPVMRRIDNNEFITTVYKTPLTINHYRYNDVLVFKYINHFNNSLNYATIEKKYLNVIESLCDDVIRYEINQKNTSKFSPIICVCKKGDTIHRWMIGQVDISCQLNKILKGEL